MTTSEEFQFAVMEAERLRKKLAEKDREIERLTETVSTLDRAEAQLRTKVPRAAEAIAAILDAERMNLTDSEREWCIAQAEGWLADYESRNVSTSSEVATDGDAQEEQ